MKKVWICLLALCILASIAGCAASAANQNDNAVVSPPISAVQATESKTITDPPAMTAESAAPETTSPATEKPAAEQAPAEEPAPAAKAADASGYIGEDAALQAALAHAGIDAAAIEHQWIKLDRDDGRVEYDVEFFSGNTEYDYEIDATTGEILSFDYDMEHYDGSAAGGSNAASSPDAAHISMDEAKGIALAKAGLTESQVRFTETSFEYDDGRAEYQIDFICGEKEYDVEINAETGAIIEYEVESIYD